MGLVNLVDLRAAMLADKARLDRVVKLVPNGTGAVTYTKEVDYAVKALSKIKDIHNKKINLDAVGECLIETVSLGLTLSPAGGQVYLINPPNVTAEISYRGIEQLYYARAGLLQLQVDLVREGDQFEVVNSSAGPGYTHKPQFGFSEEPPRVVAAYCFARFASGATFLEVMNHHDLAAVKRAAIKKANGSLPASYAAWEGEMQKKTVVRRATKHWPQGDRGEAIAEIVEQYSTPVDLETIEPAARLAKDDTAYMTEEDLQIIFAPLRDRLAFNEVIPTDIDETVGIWGGRFLAMLKSDSWDRVPADMRDEVLGRVVKRVNATYPIPEPKKE